MDDITQKPEFQRIVEEAAQYRVLREVVRALDRDEKKWIADRRDVLPGNKSDVA